MWKAYFYHNKTERIAALLLLLILLVITAASWWLAYSGSQQKMETGAFAAEVRAFEEDIAWAEAQKTKAYNNYSKRAYPKKRYEKTYEPKDKKDDTRPIELFPFNPNQASKEELMSLGLSSRTAQSILNYREKGGQFRIKSDLAKIYTLDPKDYDRLVAYIQLPDSLQSPKIATKPQNSKHPNKTSSSPTAIILEINQASAEDFQKLRGIGTAFSKRIVKYREALGGFADVSQLGEVYGLPDSTFLRIRKQLRCEGQIQKINLNTATAEELKSHPYLRWKHANAIVRYRKEHGPYTNPEILRTFFEFDDGYGTYWKIKPYLTL